MLMRMTPREGHVDELREEKGRIADVISLSKRK